MPRPTGHYSSALIKTTSHALPHPQLSPESESRAGSLGSCVTPLLLLQLFAIHQFLPILPQLSIISDISRPAGHRTINESPQVSRCSRSISDAVNERKCCSCCSLHVARFTPLTLFTSVVPETYLVTVIAAKTVFNLAKDY